jgi:hypothetical protein
MSNLDDAINRLDGSVDRLEASLTAALGRGGSAEMLASELEAAKRDYAALAATTDDVSAKLDTAIGRLKFVLDS